MYGQIHCVIRELVQTKFGNEAWETILRKSNLDEHTSFFMFNRYDDASTFSLVGAVADTLGVPVETVLEIFGEFFFDYCLRHGYDKMLRTLGSDIKSFIQNLDSLHSLLALSYKGIAAPSFRCEDGNNGELILHYYSGRPGLYPIVKGVLKAVARDLFQQSVEMSIIEQNKEDIGCNQSQEHTAFRVLLRTESVASERLTPDSETSENRALVEFKPETVLLRASDFCSAFPYHIIFDKDLRIRQCGDLIQKHSRVPLTDGLPLTSAFSIVHPKMVLSIQNIRKFINAVFLLAITPKENGRRTLLLKGQMVWLADTRHMIFIGSPRLTSLNELMEMNVYLADIPLYDVTRELVLLNQQRIAEIDIAKKLDETTAELKQTSQALEKEKSKTETLLHQMLPRKVANALTNGRKVEAEKFDQVTILFSDIVTFTNIAAACSPLDIVNMLNEMYQRFDERTSQHNVYKVETIGDAYMIVSGVPEKTSYHAQPVANFAMDMIEDAGLVPSPATGLPLQIRVGVHTGPVVAGVVGMKMPRYCLFGDTVNTASRMESHGLPGRIHLSPTVYKALRGWGYAFKHRGEMEVKGKGKMSTYFLCGHLKRRLKDPDDDFKDLEIHEDGTENGMFVPRSSSSQDGLDASGFVEGDVCDSGLASQTTRNSDEEDKEAPRFYSGSSVEQSPERPYNSFLEPGVGQNSDITEELSSQSKLVRNKKISRSSNEYLQQDDYSKEIDHQSLDKNDSKTNGDLSSSSTKNSLNEGQSDCVYISGSFKNNYHGKTPTEIDEDKIPDTIDEVTPKSASNGLSLPPKPQHEPQVANSEESKPSQKTVSTRDPKTTAGSKTTNKSQTKSTRTTLSKHSEGALPKKPQGKNSHLRVKQNTESKGKAKLQPKSHSLTAKKPKTTSTSGLDTKSKSSNGDSKEKPNVIISKPGSERLASVTPEKIPSPPPPTLSRSSSSSSTQSNHSMAKSETFPLPSTAVPKAQLRPPSASHGNLNTWGKDTKEKKKKRDSKLCCVS